MWSFIERLEKVIDNINEVVGRAMAWLTILMVINVFVVVILRYAFSIGFIWMQETYVWAHGIVFMLGAGYTLLHDEHVRIDLIYRSASDNYKAIVNLIGALVLGFPLMWILFDKALPFAMRSWKILEKSAEAGGLPAIYILKSVIVIFTILFSLQLLSLVIKSLKQLFGPKNPPEQQEGVTL